MASFVWATARNGTLIKLNKLCLNKSFHLESSPKYLVTCTRSFNGVLQRKLASNASSAIASFNLRPLFVSSFRRVSSCSFNAKHIHRPFTTERIQHNLNQIVDESGKSISRNESTSSKTKANDFSVKTMKYTFLAFGVFITGLSGFLIILWGSPPADGEGNIIDDEFSDLPPWKAYLLRFWRELHYYDKMIKEPSREKLLPDPLTEPYYQPPYTVVLEMTGVLVHPDWTYKTGWRFKKRPGVDYFLQQIGPPLYETVIYTSEQGFTAYPILDTLDPNGYIMYRLFRDATRYLKGHHVKDLSCLNRDLSKVIFIDWNEKSFEMQPENALKLKKWSGNDDDRTLIDLAAFLRTIATSQVDDVRSVLSFYKQFDDPVAAFKFNQKRLQEEQQKASAIHNVEKADRRSSWTSLLFKRWQ